MGWRSRVPILGPHASRVVSGGLFRPFALVDGRAAATWKMTAGGVLLEPFGRLAADDAAALDRDGQDVVRYLRAAA
jgi:hypothetical protein